MGKECVTVRESPGFVTTRINAMIGNEAFFMLQEGVASAADIDKALKLGLNHPMGPFELVDLVGSTRGCRSCASSTGRWVRSSGRARSWSSMWPPAGSGRKEWSRGNTSTPRRRVPSQPDAAVLALAIVAGGSRPEPRLRRSMKRKPDSAGSADRTGIRVARAAGKRQAKQGSQQRSAAKSRDAKPRVKRAVAKPRAGQPPAHPAREARHETGARGRAAEADDRSQPRSARRRHARFASRKRVVRSAASPKVASRKLASRKPLTRKAALRRAAAPRAGGVRHAARRGHRARAPAVRAPARARHVKAAIQGLKRRQCHAPDLAGQVEPVRDRAAPVGA